MKKNKKDQNHEISNDLPLFEKHNPVKDDVSFTPPGNKVSNSADVICFHEAVEIRKMAAHALREKNALEAILKRAKKLVW